MTIESRAVDEEQYEDRIGLVLTDKESIKENGEADATKIVMKGEFNSIIGFLDKLRDTKVKKSFGYSSFEDMRKQAKVDKISTLACCIRILFPGSFYRGDRIVRALS